MNNEQILSLEKLIESLQKETLKYKIIDNFFPDIPKNKIKDYEVFLPNSFNIYGVDYPNIIFISWVEIPTIYKKGELYDTTTVKTIQ